MQIQVYIYKRHDIDLLAIADAGYSLSMMMKNALVAYANETPIFYYIDQVLPFDLNDKKSIKVVFRVGKTDAKTFYMLNNIKHSKRGLFCKMVLRNAIIQQNLAGFFADENLINLHYSNARYFNPNAFSNVVPLSSIEKKTSFTFLNKTIDVSKPTTAFNPFSGMSGTTSAYHPQFGMPMNNPVMSLNQVVAAQISAPTTPIQPIAETKVSAPLPAYKVDTPINIDKNEPKNDIPELNNAEPSITTNSLSENNDNADTSFVFNSDLFSVFDSI